MKVESPASGTGNDHPHLYPRGEGGGSTDKCLAPVRPLLFKILFFRDLSSSGKNLPPLGSCSVAAFPRFISPFLLSQPGLVWSWLAREISGPGPGPGPASRLAVGLGDSGTHSSKLSEVLSRQSCPRGPRGNVGFSTPSSPKLPLSQA